MFKVNNKDTRSTSFTDVIIVNFEHISQKIFNVSVVDFEH